MNVDVVVVGGGIAGVSVAYELAGHADVALVDMELGLAYHASGRSAATLALSYGPPIVRQLTAWGHDFLVDPAEYFEQPLLNPRPFVRFAEQDGVDLVVGLIGEVRDTAPGIRQISDSELLDVCPMLRPGIAATAAVDSQAQDIDVHALHSGYVLGFRQRGGKVHTGWRVDRADYCDGHWELSSATGSRLVTSTVVIAGGAWTNAIGERMGARPAALTPRRRTAFMSPSHAMPPDPTWPLIAAIDGSFYLKPEGDRYLCSPIDHDVSEPCDARPDELAIARSLDDIERATVLALRHVSAAWAGLQSVSADGLPVVGFDDEVESMFWLGGQAGFGIQTAPAMARLAAGLISGTGIDAALLARGVSAEALAPRRNVLARSKAST